MGSGVHYSQMEDGGVAYPVLLPVARGQEYPQSGLAALAPQPQLGVQLLGEGRDPGQVHQAAVGVQLRHQGVAGQREEPGAGHSWTQTPLQRQIFE